MRKPITIAITGESKTGKSALARIIRAHLAYLGVQVTLDDGETPDDIYAAVEAVKPRVHIFTKSVPK